MSTSSIGIVVSPVVASLAGSFVSTAMCFGRHLQIFVMRFIPNVDRLASV